MHVTWNLLARHVDVRCNYLWWGLLAHLVLLGPWAVWCIVVDANWTTELVIATSLTACANTIYFLALRKAYRFAPVAFVYPIARSSPILIALWAWLVFGQGLTPMAIAGITISVIGLWGMAATSTQGDTRHALTWALLAALATSIYSLSDKVAVGHLPTFGSQLGFVTLGYFAAFIGLSIDQYRESGQFVPSHRPKLVYIAVGGLCIGVAYALVVQAMLELPAAHVVAYTNAGIILATVLSIGVFKERDNWVRRSLSVAIIACGLVAIAWGK
jgi:phosphonate utilization associated putative membrane protein